MPVMQLARAWELVAGARSATLGTIAASGEPRLVPIVFAVAPGPRVLSAVDDKPKSTRRLARLADIARDPRVSVLVDHYDEDWSRLWWVRITGTAVVVDEPPPGAEVLAGRYAAYRRRAPTGPWVVITPGRVSGWEAQPPVDGMRSGRAR